MSLGALAVVSTRDQARTFPQHVVRRAACVLNLHVCTVELHVSICYGQLAWPALNLGLGI